MLVAKFACYSLQKLLVAKNHLLFVAKLSRYSLQTMRVANIHLWRVANIHLWLVEKFARFSLERLYFAKRTLVTRCKIPSLLVANNACCKFTCHSLQNSLVTRCRKSLVIRRKIIPLLVAEVACCKNSAHCRNSFVAPCKLRSLLVA